MYDDYSPMRSAEVTRSAAPLVKQQVAEAASFLLPFGILCVADFCTNHVIIITHQIHLFVCLFVYLYPLKDPALNCDGD